MKFIFVIVLGLHCGFAKAQSDQDNAKLIVSHRLKMKSTTEFDKWNADQWTFAVTDCLLNAKLPVPAEIAKLPVFKAGSFRSPKNRNEFCKALAKGPSPQCFTLKSTAAPFLFPPAGMSTDYVYMKKFIPDDTRVTVGGECNLVKDEYSTKQFFAGEGKVLWLLKPSIQSVMTNKGPTALNMGTLSFKVEGMPDKSQPVSAVIMAN